VPESPEPSYDDPPRQSRSTHHSQKKVPEFLKRYAPHGRFPTQMSVRNLYVYGYCLQDLTAAVNTGREQPALILTEAVRTEDDTGALDCANRLRVDGNKRELARWCEDERGRVQQRAGAAKTFL